MTATADVSFIDGLLTEQSSPFAGWIHVSVIFTALFIGFFLILAFTKSDIWDRFAKGRLFTSRLILFTALFAVTLPLSSLMQNMQNMRMGTALHYAKPDPMEAAIKSGIANEALKSQLKDRLSPEKAKTVDCLTGLISTEVQERIFACQKDRSCIDTIKPLAKDEVAALLKKKLEEKDALSPLCEGIDPAAL